MKRRANLSVLCLLVVFATELVNAQDRIFTYTYQSQVLGPQQYEIEVWNTLRWGRPNYYRSLVQRVEFETGLARNLQTAFYLNFNSTSAATAASGSPPTGASLESGTELSFSNEWKYKLLDPVADPVGLALYGEFTIGSAEFELEPRLILDKVTGITTLALNISAEFESETEIHPDGSEETEHSTEVHVNFAAGFRIAAGVHLGIEVFSKNGLTDGELGYSALYAGPTISYAVDRFWANVTFMPQLGALKGATSDGLVLTGAERYQTRLLIAYAL
jgi:hypothetical protein